jgi:hypothetical protein
VTSDKEIFLLDFFTERANQSIHGTLSLINGIPRSTWTVVKVPVVKNTYDTALAEDQFRGIWDRISDIETLREFSVTKPETKISFRDHYAIGIAFSFSGSQGKHIYLIPHDCRVKEIVDWIHDIEIHSQIKNAE